MKRTYRARVIVNIEGERDVGNLGVADNHVPSLEADRETIVF